MHANYETANEKRESNNAIYRLPTSFHSSPFRAFSSASYALRFAILVSKIHGITYSIAIYDMPEPCELTAYKGICFIAV